MALGVPALHVYDHLEHLLSGQHADPDVLEYAAIDNLRRAEASSHASASDPPPPYQAFFDPSYSPLPSPLPTPPFHQYTHPALGIDGPSVLHPTGDPAYRPDSPFDRQYYIMTPDEHIRVVQHLQPQWRPPIPPTLQPGRGRGIPVMPPVLHVRSHSMQYDSSASYERPANVIPPPSTTPTASSLTGNLPTISTSQLFPIHAMWRPPAVSTTSSSDSDYSSDGCSTPSPQTPPGVPDPSPSPDSVYSREHIATPVLKTSVSPSQGPGTRSQGNSASVRVVPPPRSSSFATTPQRTSPQAPVPISTASTTALQKNAPAQSYRQNRRPVPPIHNNSAPELRVRPPPPQTLSRSATAPSRPPSQVIEQPRPIARSQTQTRSHENRGRSREQQAQNSQRQHSRKPSVSAPRDLDRIDELDETDPRGLAWHHGGPYEAIRSMSQKRSDGTGTQGAGSGARAQAPFVGMGDNPVDPFTTAFSIQPGQIFPSGVLQKTMTPIPQPTTDNPSFEPYHLKPPDRKQSSQTPGVPSTPSRTWIASGQQGPKGLIREDTMPPSGSSTDRPPLQQRPSQRSHVRFESPTRPEVRPPLKQGSVSDVDENREPPTSVGQSTNFAEPPRTNYTGAYVNGSYSTSAPAPDLPLPPRPNAPSAQSQQSLPPHHIPKHLVMPTPLQPAEEQRRNERMHLDQARQMQPPLGRATRSDEGHGSRTGVHAQGGRHVLHHSNTISHQQGSDRGYATPQPDEYSSQAGQPRAEAAPRSGGHNVLRKRSSHYVPSSAPADKVASSSASAAFFATQVVDPPSKGKVTGNVPATAWPSDPDMYEPERIDQKKVGRKLSKLTKRK